MGRRLFSSHFVRLVMRVPRRPFAPRSADSGPDGASSASRPNAIAGRFPVPCQCSRLSLGLVPHVMRALPRFPETCFFAHPPAIQTASMTRSPERHEPLFASTPRPRRKLQWSSPPVNGALQAERNASGERPSPASFGRCPRAPLSVSSSEGNHGPATVRRESSPPRGSAVPAPRAIISQSAAPFPAAEAGAAAVPPSRPGFEVPALSSRCTGCPLANGPSRPCTDPFARQANTSQPPSRPRAVIRGPRGTPFVLVGFIPRKKVVESRLELEDASGSGVWSPRIARQSPPTRLPRRPIPQSPRRFEPRAVGGADPGGLHAAEDPRRTSVNG